MNSLCADRIDPAVRRKAVWGPRITLATLVALALGSVPIVEASGRGSSASQSERRQGREGARAKPGAPSSRVRHYKVDDEVTRRSARYPRGTTSVIVTLVKGGQVPPQLRRYMRGSRLDIINGQALDLPNGLIKQLEAHPEVFRVHHNRPIGKENYRTYVTVGANTVAANHGYTGKGVGVAVVDSGIATWHDDLTQGIGATIYPFGNQRVKAFVDFVNGRTLPYDDNGHGSHVAGIVAGNGYNSGGEKTGIAPGASLVSLKVLDADGVGTISNIIAAFNWVLVNHKTYNIRVVNVSVGAKIRESYWTDPLTLAAKALVDKGIVVVGAAGNFGKNADGQLQYGGITAPSNAPWVLTVGASSTEGTLTRKDDVLAGFSSSGPSYIDFAAKPDLVAPGVGTISLAVPGSTFYLTKQQHLIGGSQLLATKPYLTLSGTSMAAPVVSGTVALMLQANPTLTPNLVKAILQYTAESRVDYHPLRQGAGFLNTLGAVKLAQFYAQNTAGVRMPIQKIWSRQIVWGNQRLVGGYINPRANAWSDNIVWGTARSFAGDNIVWGTECGLGCDNIVWGTGDANGDNIVWGTRGNDNIVWGTGGLDNIVWGTRFFGDNIVWGTSGGDNIVWGTGCGGADCDNIVWGTGGLDNIVWGTVRFGDNIVWGTAGLDNIVWGTWGVDNIVWGTSTEGDATWGSSGEDQVSFVEPEGSEPLPDVALEFGEDIAVEPSLAPAATEAIADPVSTVESVLPTQEAVGSTLPIGGGL